MKMPEEEKSSADDEVGSPWGEEPVSRLLEPDSDLDPERRILLAAIQAIEEEGIQQVTIRGIARRAGVNSAAINYYYRSKERLLDQVMEYTLENAFGDIGDFIPAGPIASTGPFKEYLKHMLWGMRTYPGIARAHFYAPLVESDVATRAVTRMNDFLSGIFDRMSEQVPRSRHGALRWSLVQLMSSLLMSGLAPDVFHSFLEGSLRDQPELNAYVDSLVDRLLGPFFASNT